MNFKDFVKTNSVKPKAVTKKPVKPVKQTHQTVHSTKEVLKRNVNG